MCDLFWKGDFFKYHKVHKESGKIKVNTHVMFSCSLGLCEAAKYGICTGNSMNCSGIWQ